MALTIYGDYSFVFANPEALVLNKKWRKMIQTPVYQTNLFGIVADEAHVILYVHCYLFTEVLYVNVNVYVIGHSPSGLFRTNVNK